MDWLKKKISFSVLQQWKLNVCYAAKSNNRRYFRSTYTEHVPSRSTSGKFLSPPPHSSPGSQYSKIRASSSEILERPPEIYQDPILWAWLEMFLSLKGALSQGFRRFLVLPVLKSVVGNFAHEKQYFWTSKGRYNLNMWIETQLRL